MKMENGASLFTDLTWIIGIIAFIRTWRYAEKDYCLCIIKLTRLRQACTKVL